MQRYQTFGPRDEQPGVAGDSFWRGVDLRRNPRQLEEGLAAEAVNMRFRNGIPETRKGCMKIAWANYRYDLTEQKVRPFGNFFGRGTFNDPDDVRWEIIADSGHVYRIKEGNQAETVPMPVECIPNYAMTFVQAFGYLVMFRGKGMASLVCEDVATGFRYVSEFIEISNFKFGSTYADGNEIVWPALPGVAYDAAATYADGDIVMWTDGYHYEANQAVATGETPETDPAKWNLISWRPNTTYASGSYVVFEATLYKAAAESRTQRPIDFPDVWVPVVHRVYEASTATTAGDTPESAEEKWTHTRDVLPNAEQGLYAQNRLVIPHDRDLLAVSDPVAVWTFAPAINDFRINSGTSDGIVTLRMYDDFTLLIFKSKSFYALENFYGDLSAVRLTEITQGYGLLGKKAWCRAGEGVWAFTQRGVVRLRRREDGKIRVDDLPMSTAIQPLIERIDGQFASNATAIYHDNKFYLAVRFVQRFESTEELIPEDQMFPVATDDFGSEDGIIKSEFTVSGLTAGKTYVIDLGENGILWRNGAAYGSESYTIVANSTEMIFRGPEQTPATYASLSRLPYVVEGCNNAVLVYDFLNEAWCGYDEGEGLKPVEFFTMPYGGQERLWFLSADRYVNLYEEGAHDQLGAVVEESGLVVWPVSSSFTTRAYVGGSSVASPHRWNEVQVHLETWHPKFSVDLVFPGVEEEKAVLTDVERSRTAYYKPFNAPAYVTSNENDDHAAPYRQDYSVDLSTPTYLGENGINFDRFQDHIWRAHISRKDNAVQVRISNTQGRIRILSVGVSGTASGRRQGVHF